MKNVCGAKTRNGTPCQKAPMTNGRCALHGGKSLKGEASPTFKHGKFSEYLPQRLVKIYEDVQTDDEHTLLSRNIRLREMFIRERLAMIDDIPDSAETWKQLRDAVKELNKAYRNSDDGKVYGAIADIENIIDERALYFQAVEEIRIDLAEQRKDKQVISAIEQRGENAITAKELMVFMGAVLHVINNTVTSQPERIRIHQEIDNLFSRPPQSVAIQLPTE
jgi:hypothetical protein